MNQPNLDHLLGDGSDVDDYDDETGEYLAQPLSSKYEEKEDSKKAKPDKEKETAQKMQKKQPGKIPNRFDKPELMKKNVKSNVRPQNTTQKVQDSEKSLVALYKHEPK